MGAKTYFVRPATATGQQCFYAEDAKHADPEEDTIIENPVSGGVSGGVSKGVGGGVSDGVSGGVSKDMGGGVSDGVGGGVRVWVEE